MNKKKWFIYFGCLIVGLALGYLSCMIHYGGLVADSLALGTDKQLYDLGHRAFKAYQGESRPVAIYAQSNYLATLQDAESIDAHDSSFMPETEVQRCLMFTHARLAKLLAENGQTQASTNHIAAALKYAQETINAPEPMRRFSSVTNQVKLFEVLDEFDKRGLP